MGPVRYLALLVVIALMPACAATNAVHHRTRTTCTNDSFGPIRKAYLTGNGHLVVCFTGTVRYRGETRKGRHRLDIPLNPYKGPETTRRRRHIELSRRRLAPGWPDDEEIARHSMEEVDLEAFSEPWSPDGGMSQPGGSKWLTFVYTFEDNGKSRKLQFRLRSYDVARPVLTGAALVPATIVDVVTSPIQFIGLVAYMAQGQP